MRFIANWTAFSPAPVDFTDALRRAFKLPEDEDGSKFDELLRRLR